MAEAVPIIQNLYCASQQGRWVCASCNDGAHRKCELHKCDCAHRDPVPKGPPKAKRDKDGLTDEERKAQDNIPFDSFEPLTIKAETLKTRRQNTPE
jgi:hypothetical protein